METKDLVKKTDADLTKLLAEKREELRAFRFSEAGTRTRNVKEGKNARRTIARVLTELRSRFIALAESDKIA